SEAGASDSYIKPRLTLPRKWFRPRRIITAALFLSQNNTLTLATTLSPVFFGINDFGASSTDGNHLPQAAAALLAQIKQLAAAPTNAKNIVVLQKCVSDDTRYCHREEARYARPCVTSAPENSAWFPTLSEQASAAKRAWARW
ncbi:hypothetical protein B0H19DRAFT_1038321, partial [Mycena capillaripes]